MADFITREDREKVYEKACARLGAAMEASMPRLPHAEQRALSLAITDVIVAAAAVAAAQIREETTDP